MTFLLVVGGCLLAFMLLCWQLWDEISKVIKWLRNHHDRISSLEVKDYQQDARLDMHRKVLIQAKKDIKALGKDVGWDDNNRATQVMETQSVLELVKKTKNEPPDEPPPDAA